MDVPLFPLERVSDRIAVSGVLAETFLPQERVQQRTVDRCLGPGDPLERASERIEDWLKKILAQGSNLFKFAGTYPHDLVLHVCMI